jgi:hypothetical protein
MALITKKNKQVLEKIDVFWNTKKLLALTTCICDTWYAALHHSEIDIFQNSGY